MTVTDSELIMQCLMLWFKFWSTLSPAICDAAYACVRLTERRMRRCWNTPSKEPPRMSMNLSVHSVGTIHWQVRDNLSKQFKFNSGSGCHFLKRQLELRLGYK